MRLKNIFRHRGVDIALLLLVALFVHRSWLQSDILISGEGQQYPDDYLKSRISMPYLWESRNGGRPGDINVYRHPFLFVRGLAASALPGGLGDRVLHVVLLIAIPGLSMYLLASYLSGGDRTAAFFASLFFAFNTYILHLTLGGQARNALAFAFAPLPLLLFIKGMDRSSLKYCLLGGLALSINICFEIRVAYLGGIIIVLYFLFHMTTVREEPGSSPVTGKRLRSLAGAAVFFLVPLLLNLYWLVPAVMQQSSLSPPGSLGQPYWIYGHNPVTLGRAVTAFHPWAANPLEQVGTVELEDVRYLYWLIPLLALAAPLLVRKKRVWFFAAIAVVFVFFAKGAHAPFGGAYIWCFKHLPGFGGFRDPSKFFLGVTLAYSVLLGFTVSAVCRNLARAVPEGRALLSKAVLVGACAWLFYMIYPHWDDQLIGGTFLPRPAGDGYARTTEFLEADTSDFRTLSHPFRGIYHCRSVKHPFMGGVDYHTFDLFMWREDINKKCLEQTRYWGKLIGLLNLKYVVLPPEVRGEWIYDAFRTTREEHRARLLEQRDILPTTDPWVLYNKDSLPRFYVASSGALVAGGLRSLVGMAELSGERQVFADLVVFFTDELKESSLDAAAGTGTVIFFRQDLDDLVLSVTGPADRVDLWDHAVYMGDNDEDSLSFERTVWAPNGQLGTVQGELAQSTKGVVDYWAAGKKRRMQVVLSVSEPGTYELWIRIGFDPDNGKLDLSLDGDRLASLRPRKKSGRYRWHRAGERDLEVGEHLLGISSRGLGKRQMDQVILLSKREREAQQARVEEMLKEKTVLYLSGPEYNEGQWMLTGKDGEPAMLSRSVGSVESRAVVWTQEDPTRYELSYRQDRPGHLVFSETHSPEWVLRLEDGEVIRSRRAYGRINAFYVEKTGEVNGTVEYLPQRYLEAGLVAGFSGLVLGAGFLVFFRIRAGKKSKLNRCKRRLIEVPRAPALESDAGPGS